MWNGENVVVVCGAVIQMVEGGDVPLWWALQTDWITFSHGFIERIQLSANHAKGFAR